MFNNAEFLDYRELVCHLLFAKNSSILWCHSQFIFQLAKSLERYFTNMDSFDFRLLLTR